MKPEVTKSPSLSLLARPGDGSIRARRVAILVADGVDGAALRALADRLTAEGAVPRFVGAAARHGAGRRAATPIEVDAPIAALPSVLFDAVVLPDGDAAVRALAADGRVLEFVKDQYRHCKPILVLGAASALIERAGIPGTLPSGEPDPGLLIGTSASADTFVAAIAAHRHFGRETDPPRV